jgi:hypothetical protein
MTPERGLVLCALCVCLDGGLACGTSSTMRITVKDTNGVALKSEARVQILGPGQQFAEPHHQSPDGRILTLRYVREGGALRLRCSTCEEVTLLGRDGVIPTELKTEKEFQVLDEALSWLREGKDTPILVPSQIHASGIDWDIYLAADASNIATVTRRDRSDTVSVVGLLAGTGGLIAGIAGLASGKRSIAVVGFLMCGGGFAAAAARPTTETMVYRAP